MAGTRTILDAVEEFKEKQSLSEDFLKKFEEQLRTENLTREELSEALGKLAAVACEDEDKFDRRSKKHVIDVLTSIIIQMKAKLTLGILKPVIEALVGRMFQEKEAHAISFTSIIQEIMNSYAVSENGKFMEYFGDFYKVLEEKIKMLGKIDVTKLTEEALSIDRKTVKKLVTMEHSLIYYTDITTHILLLIERNIVSKNKEIFDCIKLITRDLASGLSKINLEDLEDKIHPEYMKDLISSINKSIQIFNKIIISGKKGRLNPKLQIYSYFAAEIEINSNTNKYQDCLLIVIKTLKILIKINPGQIADLFLIIPNFNQINPEFIFKNFDSIFIPNFFRDNSNNWTIHVFNSIFNNWEIAMKDLLLQASSHGTEFSVISHLSKDQFMTLVDNLIDLIYSQKIYPTFMMKIMYYLKNLVQKVINDSHTKVYQEITEQNKQNTKMIDFLVPLLKRLMLIFKMLKATMKEI